MQRICEPTSEEGLAILKRLYKRLGHARTVAAGIESDSLSRWLSGAPMRPLARRYVWLLYAVTCRPDLLETFFDLATFGRFKSGDCDAKALAEHLLNRQTGPRKTGKVRPPGPPWKRNAALKRAYLMPGSGLPITL